LSTKRQKEMVSGIQEETQRFEKIMESLDFASNEVIIMILIILK